MSVGAQLSICVVLAGMAGSGGSGAPVAALLAIGCCATMGSLNVALVAFANLPSIVVTLATLVIFRQSLLYFGEGTSIYDLPARFAWFGAGQTVGQWLVIGISLGGLLLSILATTFIAAGRAVCPPGPTLP